MPTFRHFSFDEFDCPCCGKNWIKVSFVKKLDLVRDQLGAPIYVDSGYRCADHNEKVGGKRGSQHLRGGAADIRAEDMDKLYEICCEVFKAVGDGRAKGFIHVDDRSEIHRWVY